MVVEERVLPDATENVTSSDVVANFVFTRLEVPLLGTVERWDVDSTGNVDTFTFVGDTLERALNAVVDGLHQTRAELDREGLACSGDGVANGDTGWDRIRMMYQLTLWICLLTSFFVDLDGRLVVLYPNDLTDE